MKLRWRSNWKVTLLVVLLLPGLMRLGFWQLDRAEQKRNIEATFIERASMPSLSARELGELEVDERAHVSSPLESSVGYRTVAIEGRYLNEYNALLDNRIENGRPGYHVLSPFASNSGMIFWINRGWLAGNPDRSLPLIPEVDHQVSIVASVYIPVGNAVVLAAENWPKGWPVLIQSADIAGLNDRLTSDAVTANDTFKYQLRLEPGYAGALTVDWPVINASPAKHTGYAVQWFAMSAALLIFWLYLSIAGANRQ